TQTIVTMSSSSNRPAIQMVKWMPDNTTVAFLGENRGETQQLYLLNTSTRAIIRLTNHPTNLLSYSITPKQNRFAYIAEAPVVNLIQDSNRRKGIVVSAQRLDLLLAGRQEPRFDTNQLFVADREPASQVPYTGQIGRDPDCAISPDGKYIISETDSESFP